MSLNKVMLIGRLGKDPESHATSSSTVCNFSVAVTESWTDKSGAKQERVEWCRIVVWGKLAEICAAHLKKGRQVYVEGRLQTREWKDKDGQTKYTTEINAQSVQFLGDKPTSAPSQAREPGDDSDSFGGFR